MTDFVPQRAIETTIVCSVFRLFIAYRSRECTRGAVEDIGVTHDVGAQKNRAPVTSGKIAFIWKYRGRVASACLTEVSNYVINAYGYVFANFLMVSVWK